MDSYLGQILLVGFNIVPRNWAPCDGQQLPIRSYNALFALVGTYYGGNGTTTFALPDLRGRVPVCFAQGPGLSDIQLAERAGFESVNLTTSNLPSHTHALRAYSGAADAAQPGTGVVLARTVVNGGTPLNAYASVAPNTALNSNSIASTGNSNALSIRTRALGLSYIICTNGVFPSRN